MLDERGTKWSDQENSKRGRWEEGIQKENSEYGFGITNNLETNQEFPTNREAFSTDKELSRKGIDRQGEEKLCVI